MGSPNQTRPLCRYPALTRCSTLLPLWTARCTTKSAPSPWSCCAQRRKSCGRYCKAACTTPLKASGCNACLTMIHRGTGRGCGTSNSCRGGFPLRSPSPAAATRTSITSTTARKTSGGMTSTLRRTSCGTTAALHCPPIRRWTWSSTAHRTPRRSISSAAKARQMCRCRSTSPMRAALPKRPSGSIWRGWISRTAKTLP